MVNEYKVFHYSLISSYIEKFPKNIHLVLAFVLIEYFYKRVPKVVPYLVHNPITFHVTKEVPLRLPTIFKRIDQ